MGELQNQNQQFRGSIQRLRPGAHRECLEKTEKYCNDDTNIKQNCKDFEFGEMKKCEEFDTTKKCLKYEKPVEVCKNVTSVEWIKYPCMCGSWLKYWPCMRSFAKDVFKLVCETAVDVTSAVSSTSECLKEVVSKGACVAWGTTVDHGKCFGSMMKTGGECMVGSGVKCLKFAVECTAVQIGDAASLAKKCGFDMMPFVSVDE